MSETPTNPWIHIGECPVCINGLGRVRTCGEGESRHFYAVCDECEAIWKEPDIASKRDFADAEDPRCPLCAEALYGEQSHWSLTSDILGTPWHEKATIEPNNDIIGEQPSGTGAGKTESDNLDSDALASAGEERLSGDTLDDELRPGC